MTSVKHWVIFTDSMGWEPLLFSLAEVMQGNGLTLGRQLQVEQKLLLFVCWLDMAEPPYTGSTVVAYVNDIMARHFRWLGGVTFKSCIRCTQRLSMAYKVIRRERPSQLRSQIGFEHSWFDIIWAGSKHHMLLDNETGFLYRRTYAQSALAFEQLLRMNECADTETISIANADPMLLSDVYPFDHDGQPLEFNDDGTIRNVHTLKFLRIRMPPSKADFMGANTDLAVPARTDGVQLGIEIPWCACDAIVASIQWDPVPRGLHHCTPLFRRTRATTPLQGTARQHWKTFKKMCEAGDPMGRILRWKLLSAHAFRIGGMNRLQQLGAGPAEIMALGRWASDCWKIYSRRLWGSLMNWTAQMVERNEGQR